MCLFKDLLEKVIQEIEAITTLHIFRQKMCLEGACSEWLPGHCLAVDKVFRVFISTLQFQSLGLV